MPKQLLFIFVFLSLTLFSQNIVVNEVCTKNNNVVADDDFNQFVDWVELYNAETSSLNLSGYYLTDDSLQKTKWQFPPGSFISADAYLLVWADGNDTTLQSYHTNFKLSTTNECVALYDPNLNLISLITYPDQYTDISYGRTSSSMAYFSTPTPNGANTTAAYYSDDRHDAPEFQLASGFYIANTELVISAVMPGEQVRYTTDGSNPNINSTLYSEPIILTENAVIRAKTFGNFLPSPEISCTYFIETVKQLPVVSLIINPDFLWSDSIGIFNDYEIDKRVDWERFSKIQYFRDNSLKFETNNDIRLFGATAYQLPQKSFAVFANNEIQYQIFDGKEISNFDSFVMRSSSDDWTKTMFRDGFVQSIVQEKLDIDYQAYQPTVLYINGEYFGIFNLREKYNEDYLKHNHGIDKDSIDMLQLNYWGLNVEVIAGSNQKYYEMLNYLNANDMTDDIVFTGVGNYLDIENYTNYIITQIYIANISYNHNIKAWRENHFIDGFKWLIYDTDRAYTDAYRQVFLSIYGHDPVLKRLLENINYRNHFLQQTCSHINATFRVPYIFHLVDSLKSNIAQEMPFHIEKWAPFGGVSSMDKWNNEVYILKDFALKRKDTLLYRLDSMYNLAGQVAVHLNKISPQGGDVYIEDVLIPYNDMDHTYFKGVPVKLVAKPHLGYSFVEWENISSNDTIVHTFNSDETINAKFVADCSIPQVITQDAMLLKDCSPYHFENDLTVEIGATLYCEPGVEVFFGEDVQLKVYGSLEFTGTENEPVIIQGEPGIYWKYITLDNGNISMKHVTVYSGEKAILFVHGGKLLIENCTFYESGKNINDLISGNSSVLEIKNNIFFGNATNSKSDCIDGDEIPSGIFTGNTFYNISDDCIDIGNNSFNIYIGQNEAYDCKSMGISIGESSTAYIEGNLLVNCHGGIQVHTEAMATIINNTLYGNETGIRCFHNDDLPNTGGTAEVVNTIFSDCALDYELQPNSQIDIVYSLSDQTLHSGIGNIFDNPAFIKIAENNFHLQASSPCIDAGDVLTVPDPDGTRADIGAFYFDHNNLIPELNNAVLVYPNPFFNRFTIRLDSSSLINDIDIYDVLGQHIFSRQHIGNNSFIVETESKGLLFVVISDIKGNKYTTKIIAN